MRMGCPVREPGMAMERPFCVDGIQYLRWPGGKQATNRITSNAEGGLSFQLDTKWTLAHPCMEALVDEPG